MNAGGPYPIPQALPKVVENHSAAEPSHQRHTPPELMHKLIVNLTTSAILIVGWGAIAAPLRADMDHGHGDSPAAIETLPHDGEPNGHHGHGHLEISEGQPVPVVVVDIFPDPVSGWNVQVQTENWEFAPERVNQNSVTTEGHAHLYVNGEKVTRIYNEWSYIPSLPPGEHVLTVGLNANGHETLTHNGEPIEASVKVIVPEVNGEMSLRI